MNNGGKKVLYGLATSIPVSLLAYTVGSAGNGIRFDIQTLIFIVSLIAVLAVIWGCSVNEKIELLMTAQQATMRLRLITDARVFIRRGKIRQDDRDMWESAYQAYHNLGQNGVLDSYRDKIQALPVLEND